LLVNRLTAYLEIGVGLRFVVGDSSKDAMSFWLKTTDHNKFDNFFSDLEI
jgi:hypothetical protein